MVVVVVEVEVMVSDVVEVLEVVVPRSLDAVV